MCRGFCCLVPVVGTPPAADVYNYYYRLCVPRADGVWGLAAAASERSVPGGGRLYEATLVYVVGDGVVVRHRRDNMPRY